MERNSALKFASRWCSSFVDEALYITVFGVSANRLWDSTVGVTSDPTFLSIKDSRERLFRSENIP